jgi:DNA-binding transcriptional ArsR family regulator
VSRERAPRGAAQQAIIAALEHGSHTVSELAVVTAMSGPNIRENLRRLLKAGAVTRAKREGKAAYALSRSAHASV